MDTSEAEHATAARLENTISDTPHTTPPTAAFFESLRWAIWDAVLSWRKCAHRKTAMAMADDESKLLSGQPDRRRRAPKNEHAARAYLELCRDTVLDQNRISKQHSAAGGGIITLATVLFGIQLKVAEALAAEAETLASGGEWQLEFAVSLAVLVLVVSLAVLVLIVSLAWRFVIMPYLTAQYDVGHAEVYVRNTASGQKAAQTLVDFAAYYRQKIDFNRWVLTQQKRYLGSISRLMVSLVSLVLLLFAYRFSLMRLS